MDPSDRPLPGAPARARRRPRPRIPYASARREWVSRFASPFGSSPTRYSDPRPSALGETIYNIGFAVHSRVIPRHIRRCRGPRATLDLVEHLEAQRPFDREGALAPGAPTRGGPADPALKAQGAAQGCAKIDEAGEREAMPPAPPAAAAEQPQALGRRHRPVGQPVV